MKIDARGRDNGEGGRKKSPHKAGLGESGRGGGIIFYLMRTGTQLDQMAPFQTSARPDLTELRPDHRRASCKKNRQR
jgi:hypothetical protein